MKRLVTVALKAAEEEGLLDGMSLSMSSAERRTIPGDAGQTRAADLSANVTRVVREHTRSSDALNQRPSAGIAPAVCAAGAFSRG